MLRLLQLEELESLLLDVPKLMQRYERRDFEFRQRVFEWLERLEAALERNRVPVVAKVSSLKASLLAARRGTVPSGTQAPGRTSRSSRSNADAMALKAMQDAIGLVEAETSVQRARFDEARTYARRLLAVADQKGILAGQGAGQAAGTSSYWLFDLLKKDKDLAPGITTLASMVSVPDAMILLDRGQTDFTRT